MDKLQLYIARPHQGLRTLVNINPRDDVWAHAVDARPALEEIIYDPKEKVIFYLLQYTQQGTFVTIIRTIPPTPYNYLGAWIFVPNGLRITPAELEGAVRLVTRKISMPKFDEEAANELREFFAKEYQTQDDAPRMAASTGLSYASASYGGDTGATLATYLGPYLFQPQWVPYKGVILLDADLEMKCEAQPYEASSLAVTGALLPPEKDAPTRGFTPYLYNMPLTAPTLVALDRDTTIVWKRTGFDDVTQTIIVSEAGTHVPVPAEATSHALKTVGKESFYITSPITRKEITGCQIKVNGIDVSAKPHSFEPDSLASAAVEVTCDGYLPYNARLDLASSTQALIQLKVTKRVYRFELPVKSMTYGQPIQFDIYSRQPIEGSPLEGYSLADGELHEGHTRLNRLVPDTQSKTITTDQSFWYRTVWGAVGLVIGLVIMFFIMRPVDNADDSAATEAMPAETPVITHQGEGPDQAAAPLAQSAPSTAQAAPAAVGNEPTQESIDYLDKNSTWKRDEMDAKPGLNGLYADLNGLNMDRLINYWGPRLKGSKSFAKVVSAAKNAKGKPKSIVNRAEKKDYSPDGTITWRTYTYKVDP